MSDTPIFVSKPRFLDADHVYLENITIPEPNSTLHDSFLCVEPVLHVCIFKEYYKSYSVNRSCTGCCKTSTDKHSNT